MNPARLVQSIGWMAFLGLLLLGGGYASYIASWQYSVLVAATALFGSLVLLDALLNRGVHHHDHDHHDHDHGTTTDQWVQTLVHLLPLFLILTLGVTTLGSQSITSLHRPTAHQQRPDAVQREPITPTADASRPPTAPATGAALPAQDAAVVVAPPGTPPGGTIQSFIDGPTPVEPTAPVVPGAQPALAPAVPLALLELYYPKKHPGVTRVDTIGRLMIPSAEELKNAPAEMDRDDLQLLLYRHVMTCCAADATPVFVVLRGRERGELKVDEWVRVIGTWIPAPGLGDMAKIVVDELTVIEAPKEPFLQAPTE